MIKSTIGALILSACLGSVAAQNADPAINILMQPDSLLQFTTGTLEVTAANIGNSDIEAASLEIVVSAGSNAEILGIATGSDSRWTQHALPAGTGNAIVLRNTGGFLPAASGGAVFLTVRGNVGPAADTLAGSIAYIPGANPLIPGDAPSSSQGNTQVTNDASITTVVVTNSAPLSSGLLWFRGEAKDCGAVLSWEVARAADADHFEVEESSNGRDFSRVLSVPATAEPAATARYETLTDQHAAQRFYRLRIVAKDGASVVSQVVSVTPACGGNRADAFPNPAHGEVVLRGLSRGAKVTVYNALGQFVMSVVSSGESAWIDLSGAPAGLYSARVETGGGGASTTVRITKMD